MVSGAGRIDTRRSPSARRRCRTASAGSHACANAFASAARAWSPATVSRGAISSSTRTRPSTGNHPVSRATRVARHSEIAPARRAAIVCGISSTSARAKPRCRDPRAGESRRANAISAATPRPRCAAGTPRAASASRRESCNATASRACAAAHTAFSSSNTRIRETFPTSEVAGSIAPRRATHAVSSASSTASRPAGTRSGEPPRSGSRCTTPTPCPTPVDSATSTSERMF